VWKLWKAYQSKVKSEIETLDKYNCDDKYDSLYEEYKSFNEIVEYGWEIGYKMALKNIKFVLNNTNYANESIDKIKTIFEDSFGISLIYNVFGLDFNLEVCEKFILQNYHNKAKKINFKCNELEQLDNEIYYQQKDFEKEMWKSVRTFSDVCFLGNLFCQNLIKIQPNYAMTLKEHNLHEFDTDNLKHNIEIISNYNKLGFYTTMSQPGHITPDKTNPNVTYVQRANVSGYVKLNTFIKLLNLVSQDNSLIMLYCPFENKFPDNIAEIEKIYCEKMNKYFDRFNLENRLITATFVNGKFPSHIYLSDKYKINCHTIDDIYYYHTNFSTESNHIDNYIQRELIDTDDVFSVSIIDKNWGNNILWELLLNTLCC